MDGSDQPKRRGRPFAKGNPGKPKGAKNRTTQLLEQIVEAEAVDIVKKIVKLAKAKNLAAMRILAPYCLPKRDATIVLDMVPINSPLDGAVAKRQVLQAVVTGHITPSEGQAVMDMIEKTVRALEKNQCDIETVEPATESTEASSEPERDEKE